MKKVIFTFLAVLMISLTITGVVSAALPGSGWWSDVYAQNIGGDARHPYHDSVIRKHSVAAKPMEARAFYLILDKLLPTIQDYLQITPVEML